MKKILLCAVLCSISIIGVAQDFATRFMQNHKGDKNLTCVTVSPKMMAKVTDLNMDAEMMKMISDLKSMQMITAEIYIKKYYRQAVLLAKQNANRFLPYIAYDHRKLTYEIMVRKHHNVIVELVMLSREKGKFSIINFTGNMDRKFIDRLTSSMDANSGS